MGRGVRRRGSGVPQSGRRIEIVTKSVSELRHELSASLRRHVEHAPQRVDSVAGSMMLVLLHWRPCQLAAPEVTDSPVLKAKHIEHRFIPIFAVLPDALVANRRRHLGR